MVEIEAVGGVVASLGECPVWSGAERVLYWEDIEGRAIHRFDPDANETESRQLPGRPGSFVLTDRPGDLVVAMENEIVRLDWTSGQVVETIAEVESPDTGNRLNDGRCDHAGRFVVGTMWPQGEEGRFNGALYRAQSDGSVERLETDVGIPNGLVFDPSRSRMYWADTLHATIWAWDYDLDSGQRSNRRVFFDFADEAGVPDGGCLDADGHYWSAAVYGWELIRITPDGEVDRRIELPIQKPSMPAFGGDDLSTLYVTSIGSAGNTPSEPGRDAFEPGCLLAIDAGVTGAPEPGFKGRA
ncbi:MAG: SMP-30/gluconolactonase/LRE family protein [Acidimicrobiales bacterium]